MINFSAWFFATLLILAVFQSQASFANPVHPKFRYHRTLDKYVWSPSPEYSYQIISSETNALATVYILNMTSVKWLSEEEIGNAAHWYHYLEVAVPNNLDTSIKQSHLYITSGGNTPRPPSRDTRMSLLASTTKTIATALHQIPNQFIRFASDPSHSNRYEGMLIFKHLNSSQMVLLLMHGCNLLRIQPILNGCLVYQW